MPVAAGRYGMTLVERRQRPLQRRQMVEGHAGKIVVLEMEIRVEEPEIPEPVARDQRAPPRGIGRIDVVMLTQAVQRKRDRKDEEYRDDVRTQGRGAAKAPPDQSQHGEVRADRTPPLDRNPALQLRRIGRRFAPRSAEVDRK